MGAVAEPNARAHELHSSDRDDRDDRGIAMRRHESACTESTRCHRLLERASVTVTGIWFRPPTCHPADQCSLPQRLRLWVLKNLPTRPGDIRESRPRRDRAAGPGTDRDL